MLSLRNLIFIFLFLTATQSSYCQNTEHGQRILIYSNKNDFLIPYIESVLSDLHLHTENNDRLFSKVTNLNLLLLNTRADKAFREGLNLYFPNANFANTQVNDSALKILTDNDLLLLVNENILQDKIEFQFTLYDILREKPIDKSLNEFPLRNIIKPKNSKIDFFIDVTSSNYLTVLKNELKQLFPETNFVTKYNPVFTGNIKVTGKDSFRVAVNDTVSLKISDVYDEDTPLDQIKFAVKVKDSNSTSNNNDIYFFLEGKGRNFKVVFEKKGRFQIMILVDDGSSQVPPRIIEINVVQVPKLYAVKNHFTINYPAAVFGRSSFTFEIPIIIMNSDSVYTPHFHIAVENRIKETEYAYIDSVIHVYTEIKKNNSNLFNNKKSIKAPITLVRRQKDSTYISKVKKFNYNLYEVTLRGKPYQNLDSLYLYSEYSDLLTNKVLVDLHTNNKGYLTVEAGTTFGSLNIGNLECACGSDSFETITYYQAYFGAKFIAFGYKFISVGFNERISSTIARNITFEKNPIVRHYGTTLDIGVFVSANFVLRSWDTNIQIGYNKRKTWNGFDSTFKQLQLSNLGYEGLSFAGSVFPFKNSNFGLSFNYIYVNQKFKFLRFKESNFSFGLAYRF
jgi:hypothetical protein